MKNNIPVYSVFIDGAEEGFKTVCSILPPLIAILSVSAMLRESGALDLLTKALSPLASFFGMPTEIIPLAAVRPLSGSGALGLLTDAVNTYGAESRAAKAACILCASTETTFYTVSVYFGRTKVKYTKRVIIASVLGDLTGIAAACILSGINF